MAGDMAGTAAAAADPGNRKKKRVSNAWMVQPTCCLCTLRNRAVLQLLRTQHLIAMQAQLLG
jgi:hypothetical protein